ncbi:MAG: hypothetical protein ACO1N1_13630 [Dyadobacter fermentans]
MIQTDFNWNAPLNLAIVLALLALLILQCVVLYTRHRNSGRLGVRLGLNALLWASVVAWVLDPYWPVAGKSAVGLLIAGNVPQEVAERLHDSLPAARVVSADEIEQADLDTLVIAGQDFTQGIFADIRQSRGMAAVQWLPYFKSGEASDLHWKGVVKRGGLQCVTGGIQSAEKQVLQIKYAGQTLDSVLLNPGDNRFTLSFAAFSEGRTTTTLHLDGRTIDTVRFFAQPDKPLTVRFLVDNPDFETRNLATWLGKQGHAVLYDAKLSKDIRSLLKINNTGSPDLIVTTPSNAAHAVVRKAVKDGKSVLFVQLSDPLAELRAINQAQGTGFEVTKISNEEAVPVSGILTAQPFRFTPQSYQVKAPHYPLVIEKTTGTIAASLLNETFPLQLSGDSIAYGKVWSEILAYVRPAPASVLEWDAPAFKNVPVTIHLNNFQPMPRFVRIGADTVFTTTSALNNRSAAATFQPTESGWLSLHDSLGTELFVTSHSPLRSAALMQQFIHSIQPKNGETVASNERSVAKLPGWGWLAWLVLVLALVWIEPKI